MSSSAGAIGCPNEYRTNNSEVLSSTMIGEQSIVSQEHNLDAGSGAIAFNVIGHPSSVLKRHIVPGSAVRICPAARTKGHICQQVTEGASRNGCSGRRFAIPLGRIST